MEKEMLEKFISEKKTLKEIAFYFNKGTSCIRYWLKKYGLRASYSGNARRTWTEDQMMEAIRTALNISDVLRKLGLKVRPGNYSTFKKFVVSNGIDISHLKGWKSHRYNGGGKKETPLDEVLTKNSFYSRRHLKRRLLKDGLLKNECNICKCNGEWEGKPLIMILDHINGDNIDNRKENLRMLCPNCNSQQLTFCRNVNREKVIPKNQRGKCIDCGKPIFESSTRCHKCRGISDYKVIRPTKEELMKMIAEMTWVDIGKKYGVVDSTIKKWAKQYEIHFVPRKTRESGSLPEIPTNLS